MASRQHRNRRTKETPDQAPPPYVQPTKQQRNYLIINIVLFCAWFLYLLYVAFFS
jgi:hypothetical protein